MMKIFKYFICIISICVIKADLSHGRLSIIPEYDQNRVTILFSGHRTDQFNQELFLFSVPHDVDSVSLISTKSDGRLEFITELTMEKNGLKWVKVSKDMIEFAYMINSSKYENSGERNFEYEISFSEKVQSLNLEIQQPLSAENFSYTGFNGETSDDAHGQINHTVKLESIDAFQKRLISFSYLNRRGLTTRGVLADLMNLSQQKESIDVPRKKIKRHKLYSWEPIIALGIVTLFIALILFKNRNHQLRHHNHCSQCGQQLNLADKFCAECGEKT